MLFLKEFLLGTPNEKVILQRISEELDTGKDCTDYKQVRAEYRKKIENKKNESDFSVEEEYKDFILKKELLDKYSVDNIVMQVITILGLVAIIFLASNEILEISREGYVYLIVGFVVGSGILFTTFNARSRERLVQATCYDLALDVLNEFRKKS